MYAIDRDKKTLSPLESRSFSEMELKERFDLQEWLKKKPDALGEKLLIIEEEFDKFKGTRERFDLLALDKNGSLVIIENKRDDSGKDVVWQALRYVAYCSTLTESQIIEMFRKYQGKMTGKKVTEEEASKIIRKFLGKDGIEEDDIEEIGINSGTSQRFILVAANFRKEVTSTILWLLANGIQAQCMKTSLLTHGDDLFLDIQQIIPTPEAKDYMISMSSKASEEKETKTREKIRNRFWTQLLGHFQEQGLELFRNTSPNTRTSIQCTMPDTGGNAYYTLIFKKTEAKVAFYIDNYSEKDEARRTEKNKRIFDFLCGHKEEIEKRFGDEFDWQRMDGKIASQIQYSKPFNDGHDDDNWQDMIEWLCENIQKMENAFKPEIDGIQQKL